jgi:hypothetical protein
VRWVSIAEQALAVCAALFGLFLCAPAHAEERVLRLQLSGGVGAGTIAFERPLPRGRQTLVDTAFAATELALQARVWPKERLSLAVLLAYQTSIGLELRFPALFALPEDVPVRLHRVELSAAPAIALGDGKGALGLAFPAGVVFRSLVPEVHQYDLPDYELGGLLLRGELWLELGEWITVRAGPELQWLVLVDSSLRDEGACCQGVALGGQGSIQLNAGPTLRVSLGYRESRAFVPAGNWQYRDAERLLIMRVAGEL